MAQYSYNGWEAHPDRKAIDVKASGRYPGGIKDGDVWTVLHYVDTQLHNRVEPRVEGHCWGYAYKTNANNPSQLSCHASGTAIDFNAPAHPNGKGGTFTAAQVKEIEKILAECGGAVKWLKGYDEMHFEIGVNAKTLAPIAARLKGSAPPAAKPPEPTPPEKEKGPFMALSDQEQKELLTMVRWIEGQLKNGAAPGQKSLGTTVAATLQQVQKNYNAKP